MIILYMLLGFLLAAAIFARRQMSRRKGPDDWIDLDEAWARTNHRVGSQQRRSGLLGSQPVLGSGCFGSRNY
jgi:hypothetical protein